MCSDSDADPGHKILLLPTGAHEEAVSPRAHDFYRLRRLTMPSTHSGMTCIGYGAPA